MIAVRRIEVGDATWFQYAVSLLQSPSRRLHVLENAFGYVEVERLIVEGQGLRNSDAHDFFSQDSIGFHYVICDRLDAEHTKLMIPKEKHGNGIRPASHDEQRVVRFGDRSDDFG